MSVPRTLGVLVLFAVVLGAWLVFTGSASQAAGFFPAKDLAGSEGPIELVRSDASGIEIAVDISGFESGQEMVEGVAYDVVTLAGFGAASKAGSPQVPGRKVLLGIPLGADYRLRIAVEESETVPGDYRLLPAPTPVLNLDLDSAPDPGAPAAGMAGWEYVEDQRAYSANAFYPQAIARIASSGFIRDQRYVAVQLNPVQYNPVSGKVVLHKRFTVELEFTYGRNAELGSSESDGSFEPVLSASLLNYESAANWRGKQSSAILPANLAETARGVATPALKIMVNEDGIYQVTAEDLVALDVPVTDILTTAYKVSYRDREVPIRVLESGGSLASLWFFGEKARTKYTDTNVYWLTYEGAEPGLRMPSRSASPVPTSTAEISTFYSTTVRLEEDHLYRSYVPWVGDPITDPTDPWTHWFWTFTRYPYNPYDPDHPPDMAFSAEIDGLSTTSYTATLRAFFSGLTDSSHCVEFYVNRDQNGEPVGRHEWDGLYTDELVSFAFASSHLLEDSNTVDVHVCETGAAFDITFYDWFALDLRRSYQALGDSLTFDVAAAGWQYRIDGFSADGVEIFDVSGTYTVSHLTDVEVTASGALFTAAFFDTAAEEGSRYLALTRDQLKSPLAIVKEKPSNLKATTNPVDYVVIAPKEFVTDVQPLVGHRAAQGLTVKVAELEAIFDEFNHGIYSPEAIRDFLAYAYDYWDMPTYVLLVGDGSYDYKGNLDQGNPNLLPPYLAWVDPWEGETAADNRYVAVSGGDSFPDMHIGRLPAETTAHVQTMVAKTIAYETNPPSQEWAESVLFVTDDAWEYYSYSDDLVNNYLPDPYVPIKAYYASTCLTGDLCKQVILDTLNTTGALLVNYIGHGGVQIWTGNGVWGIEDLDSLVPTTRLPVMLPMTCLDGAFHKAEKDALAEATVRIAGRGAVASWSATGQGYASGHDYLNEGFLQSVLYDGVRELGAAADVGKAWLRDAGVSEDLLETYHLFGDPALRLHALVDVAVGLAIDAPEAPGPKDVATFTLTFTNAGPGVEVGVVLTDLLPSMLVTPTVVFSSPEVLAQREGITFAWTLDDLLPGASGKIVLEATVDPHWPESEVSFFNEARIGVQTHDLVPENNVVQVGVNLKSVYLPLILKGF